MGDVSNQAAGVAVAAGRRHRAGGVAARQRRPLPDMPHQAAQIAVVGGGGGGHIPGGVAPAHRRGRNITRQTAHIAAVATGGHLPGGIAVGHTGAGAGGSHQTPGPAGGFRSGYPPGSVTAGHRGVDFTIPHQAARLFLADYPARSVAVAHNAGVRRPGARVLSHQAARVFGGAKGRTRARRGGRATGPAAADHAVVETQQTPDSAAAGSGAMLPGHRPAGDPTAAHRAAGGAVSRQRAGGGNSNGGTVPHIGHIRIRQPHIPRRPGVAGSANDAEQPHIDAIIIAAGVQIDVQVLNGVFVALKNGRELRGGAGMPPNGRPTRPAVIVGVIIIARNRAAGTRRVSPPVPVRVKVQVRPQFVPDAPVLKGRVRVIIVIPPAPHPRGPGPLPVRKRVVIRRISRIPRPRVPVPVQVIANRVQLRQRGDVNEAVVVVVVVLELPLDAQVVAGVLQGRVFVVGAEAPGVVVPAAVPGARVPVHIHIPVAVNARVPGRRLQVGGALAHGAAAAGARGLAACLGIPITGGYGRVDRPAQQPAHLRPRPRTRHRPPRIRGG